MAKGFDLLRLPGAIVERACTTLPSNHEYMMPFAAGKRPAWYCENGTRLHVLSDEQEGSLIDSSMPLEARFRV